MDEQGIKDLVAAAITEATAPGGAVMTAITTAIAAAATARAAAQTETVNAAVAAALTAQGAGALTEARVAEIVEGAFNARADSLFTWRADLRAMSTSRYSKAWASLTASPEHEAAVLEALTEDGGPMLTLLGHQASNPDNDRLNKRLEELQHQAVMTKLPHLKWKSLCLPERGAALTV